MIQQVVASFLALTLPTQNAVQQLQLQPPDRTISHSLRQIISIRELPDGRLLVTDKRSNGVWLAEPQTGQITLVRLGGSGASFQQAGPLFSLGGDSTLMVDAASGDLSVLHGISFAESGVEFPNVGVSLVGADTLGSALFVTSEEHDSTTLLVALRGAGQPRRVTRYLTGIASRSRSVDSTRGYTVVRSRLSESDVVEQPALFPDGWIAIARVSPYRVEWYPRNTAQPDVALVTPSEGRLWVATSPVSMNSPNAALFLASDGSLLLKRVNRAAEHLAFYDLVRRDGTSGILALRKEERIVGFGRNSVFLVSVSSGGELLLARHSWPPS